MSRPVLPDPDDLVVHVHVDRDGCRFEVRCGERQAVYEARRPVMSPSGGARPGSAFTGPRATASAAGCAATTGRP
jgi:hypothetical protein